MNLKSFQQSISRLPQKIVFVCIAICEMHNTIAPAQLPQWSVVWRDEFDGPAGVRPDPKKWEYEIGDGSPANPGWGNGERETYSTSTENVFLDGDGHLIIRATKRGDGYTSGRVRTRAPYLFRFGRLDARIRLPYGQGIWPALWMLGESCRHHPESWPSCGEIDVVESFGAQAGDGSRARAALHGPGYAGAGLSGLYNLPPSRRFSAGFHLFSVIWSARKIEFAVDQNVFMTATPASLPRNATWVFDEFFFVVLNVAVGGRPAPVGDPDQSTLFPQDMVVDFIRYSVER